MRKFFCVLLAASLWITSTPAAPEPPKLTRPAPNSISSLPTFSFEWQPSLGAANYDIEVATDEAFTNVIDRDTVRTPRYVHDQAWPAGDLFWRVRATSPNTTGEFSTGSKVTIQLPAKTYDLPENATVEQIQNLLLTLETPAVVNFPKDGNLRLAPLNHLIELQGKSDVIFNGNNCRITFTNPVCGLAVFEKSSRILIRDFKVDFDPVPFSVGTIVSTNEEDGSFTLKLDEGMPPFDAPHMLEHWTWGVLLDPAVPGKLLDGAPIVISTRNKQVIRGQDDTFTLKLSAPTQLKYFTPGVKWVQFSRSNGGEELVGVKESADVTCLNIVNYAISGGHYICTDSTDFKVLHCRSLIKEGRWYGGNADGVHVRSNLLGPWVEGSEWNGIGDDGLALYSKGIFIQKQLSKTKIRVTDEFFNIEPGNQLTVFRPATGSAVAENLTVTSVTPMGSSYDVSFTPPLAAPLELGDRDGTKNDMVFNASKVNSNFTIRYNIFRQIRRFGNVVRAAHGTIENNYFENVSDVPIVLRNEPDHWRNGLQSWDVVITGNVIRDSGFSAGGQGKGQIQTTIYQLGHQDGSWRGHRNIVIDNNQIWNWQYYGIKVQGADGVVITRNLMTSDSNTVFHNSQPHIPIQVNNSNDVRISGNFIQDHREIGEQCLVTDSSNAVAEP